MARIVIVIFFLFLNFSLQAQNIKTGDSSLTLTITDKSQYAFANYLFSIAKYDNAIEEYRKLLYYFPQSPLAAAANLKIADSYYHLGYYKDSIDYLNGIKDQTDDNLIKYKLAINYYDIYRIFPYTLQLEAVEKADKNLRQIDSNFINYNNVSAFLKTREKSNKDQYKKPWLAGTMSAIIPGSGSVYSGRTKEGIYSFLVVAMFSYATFEAKNSKNKSFNATYPVFGFLTLAFYGGSIYSAVNSANLYNSNIELTTLQQNREKFGIWYY